MCNVWQTPNSAEEIDLRKIEEVFSNSLFKKVEEAVLHGGEPTLRKDIKEIYRIITRSCPELHSITSSSNGLNPGLLRERVKEILSVVNTEKVTLTFTVSIDGLKETHEKIRGIKNGFDRVIESLEVLKEYRKKYPIDVKIITVVQPDNIHDLNSMKKLAEEHGVDIIFQPLMIDTFYNNSSVDPRLQFTESQLREYRDFIKDTFLKAKDLKSLYWKNYLEMMRGGKRTVPCAYDRYVLSLYPTGDVLPCAKEEWIWFGDVTKEQVDKIWYSEKSRKIRKKMIREVCPTCTFYCGAEYSLKKEFFTYLGYRLKGIFSSRPDSNT
jgi:MoaA/NifB/PqqE/SkfB family radical SAM enzyme